MNTQTKGTPVVVYNPLAIAREDVVETTTNLSAARVAGHAGGWREAQTDWQAHRLNQPLLAYTAPKHAGALGSTFSLVNVSSPRARVLAVKKAEDSDEVIVRLVEMEGQTLKNVPVSFPSAVTSAREVNAQEQGASAAQVVNGAVAFDMSAY